MPLLLSLEECVSYELQVIHTIEVRPGLGGGLEFKYCWHRPHCLSESGFILPCSNNRSIKAR
jgi:hypothetical protein